MSLSESIKRLLELSSEWGMGFFWYIGALVCIYVFFPALKTLHDNDKIAFRFFVAILFVLTFGIKLINQILMFMSVAIKFPVSSINYPFVNMFIPFGRYGYSFVYFCLGGIAFDEEERVKNTKSISVYPCILICVSCVLLFLIGVFYSKYVTGEVWDVVWEGYDTIPTLINVLSIYVLSLNVKKKHKQLYSTISKNTLGIYLLHGLVLRLTRPALLNISICANYTSTVLYGCAITLISLLVSTALHRIPIINKVF